MKHKRGGKTGLRSMAMLSSLMAALGTMAQDANSDDEFTDLEIVTIKAEKKTGLARLTGAENGYEYDQSELFKAACCSLGESFTNNASTDVNYSDAATGAKQVKLMGLSGTYVQLLGDNLPIYRGVALPFALDYVPGTFMKTLSVSKGASSVKYGYESVTGQINVEHLHPDDDEAVNINVYGDSHSKLELNADANSHYGNKLSTIFMGHGETSLMAMDDNGDGFMDKPMRNNMNFQNRWKYKTDKDLLQVGASMHYDKRDGGQMDDAARGNERYKIGIGNENYGIYAKNAVFMDRKRNENIAIMASANWDNYDARYGHKMYEAKQKNFHAQTMYETNLNKVHNLSVGVNATHDNIDWQMTREDWTRDKDEETTFGGYAQYTYTKGGTFTGMAGLRVDNSSTYGTFLTPRFHVKYSPATFVTMRGSIGKGYRSPHVMAENNNLLSSGRRIEIGKIDQEEAWNTGITTTWFVPIKGKTLTIDAEYFYTTFQSQVVTDYDTDAQTIAIGSSDDDSYSHTMQIDAKYELTRGLTVTAAYRLNDVKCTYNNRLRSKPLTNKFKGLLTVSYKTPLELWQFDANVQINGGGRLPDNYTMADGRQSWDNTYDTYPILNLQVSREFRHMTVYVGGENLTNFKQKNPIIGAENPFGTGFEPTLVWGPISGIMAYAGVRIKL